MVTAALSVLVFPKRRGRFRHTGEERTDVFEQDLVFPEHEQGLHTQISANEGVNGNERTTVQRLSVAQKSVLNMEFQSLVFRLVERNVTEEHGVILSCLGDVAGVYKNTVFISYCLQWGPGCKLYCYGSYIYWRSRFLCLV